MWEAQDIEDEAINTNETAVKRSNKETIEELFDENLKRVPVGDCDKLFELLSTLKDELQISCSATLNRMRKHIQGELSPELTSLTCKQIYQQDKLHEICLKTKELQPNAWHNLIRIMLFSKRKITDLSPTSDRTKYASSSNNVALMISSVVHPDIIHLMSQVSGPLPVENRRDYLDSGAPQYRDGLWDQIQILSNSLAPTMRNEHKDKYSTLESLDPSKGLFQDGKSFRECFNTYKSKVSELIYRFKVSGHHSSGNEMLDEIYKSFLGPGNSKDLLVFYCYLEWKDDFENYGWLHRMDGCSTACTSDQFQSPESKKKKQKITQEPIEKLMVNELLDQSEIEKNNAQTQLTNIAIIDARINQLKIWIKNEDGIATEEEIAQFRVEQRKLMGLG